MERLSEENQELEGGPSLALRIRSIRPGGEVNLAVSGLDVRASWSEMMVLGYGVG